MSEVTAFAGGCGFTLVTVAVVVEYILRRTGQGRFPYR